MHTTGLSSEGGAAASNINDDTVHYVMAQCNCDRRRATRLLQRARMNAEEAIHHHCRLMDIKNRSQLNRLVSTGWGVPNERHNTSENDVTNDPAPEEYSYSGQHFQTPPSGNGDSHKLLFDDTQTTGRSAKADSEASQSIPATPTRDILPLDVNMTPNILVPREGLLGQPINQNLVWCSSPGTSDETENTDWDFVLPKLQAPARLTPATQPSITDLIGAMQDGMSTADVDHYLGAYDQATVWGQINEQVVGFPSIFFAVETNNEEIIRTWIRYGGNANAVHEASGLPLLAFAIIHSETIQEDTSQVVATLLSLGAEPQNIPSVFYTPFNQDLLETPLMREIENTKWCTKAARMKLASSINITHRYYLDRASKTKRPSVRQQQVAKRKNAEGLLGIPYFLIGQNVAANLLLKRLLSHMMSPSKRPLVLCFAGPSGHGKTELARRLGKLLSLDLEVVDCTTFTNVNEIFGPRPPYSGYEQGSALNNFLARNSGQRCIVFMDEFEKTTREVHQALLLPFDNGEYQDRRQTHAIKVNCSQTIWILATNALDPTIKGFCEQNYDALFLNEGQEDQVTPLIKGLSKSLKEGFLQHFGSPITGRISAFIPFLQFSPGEQAVVAHKYILELAKKVRTPVNTSIGKNEKLLGNIRLRVRGDASVCSTIAEGQYHPDLGARSLIPAVKSMVEDALLEIYLEVDSFIEESSEVVDYAVSAKDGEVLVMMLGP